MAAGGASALFATLMVVLGTNTGERESKKIFSILYKKTQYFEEQSEISNVIITTLLNTISTCALITGISLSFVRQTKNKKRYLDFKVSQIFKYRVTKFVCLNIHIICI